MSIPADIPNPDQENVYYTKAALRSELAAFFEKEKVDELLSLFEDDRLITFVWDTSNVPKSFSLDVYPRNSAKYTIDISSDGSFLTFAQNPEINTIVPEDFSNLKDGARQLILDPEYHIDSLLKEPGDDIYESVDNQSLVDILCATEFELDETELQQKMEYYTVIKSIVRESLKALPTEERKMYIDAYEASRSTIDSVNSVIDSIASGQNTTFDQLVYENFINDIYPDTVGVDLSEGARGLEGTGALLVQALADLNRIYIGNSLYDGTTRTDAPSSDVYLNGSLQTTNSTLWKNFSNHFLEYLPNMEMIVDWAGGSGYPIENGGSATFSDSDKVLYDSSGAHIWKSKGLATPKVHDWYYGNLDKRLKNEEIQFSGLSDYISTIKSTKNDYKKRAELRLLGGGPLLVDQAVRKALLDLSISNIDVYDYAPKETSVLQGVSKVNYFSSIGRSGILGPVGTTPYPSKYMALSEDEYSAKPFSKTGFLSLQALLLFFTGFNQNSINFLNENVSSPNSDHDRTISMWKSLFGTQALADKVPMVYRGAVYGYGITEIEIKKALHLYEKNEDIEDIYKAFLVPKGDTQIPYNERTFFQINVNPIKCGYQRDLTSSNEGFELLAGGDIDTGNELNLETVSENYKTMGHNEEESKRKRTVSVNYESSSSLGIPTLTNKKLKQFWRSRNYSMPYFWCSCTSLWKAMTTLVLRNLLASVNSILFENREEYLVLSDSELLEIVDLDELWSEILEIIESIKSNLGSDFSLSPSADGTVILKENISSHKKNDFQNAIKEQMIPTMGAYLDFVSSVSSHDKILRVQSAQFIQINPNMHLPIEGMKSPSNPNDSNNHGGPYFSLKRMPQALNSYLDKLEVSDLEIAEGLSIQKEKSPNGRLLVDLREKSDAFLSSCITNFRHLELIDHVHDKLNKLRYFIEGFETPADVSEVFLNGYLSISKDFQDPTALRTQIESKKDLYASDSTGIGGRWEWNDSGFVNWLIQAKRKGLIFVHVLGLKKDLWSSADEVELKLKYIGDGAETTVKEVSVSYDISSGSPMRSVSARLQRYLHLYRGLDIHETSFSENTKIIWSKDIQKSESGIFPWSADDFKDNEPKRILDNVFAMSPWIFPDNYFLDVANINDYHKLIFLPIYADDLNTVTTNMVGTFEWSVGNDS